MKPDTRNTPTTPKDTKDTTARAAAPSMPAAELEADLLAIATEEAALHQRKLQRRQQYWDQTIASLSRPSKKQSPPVRGIGSGMPPILSQQLPRDSMAKCARSVGEGFLPEGVTFSSVFFSCIKPHGAVASSLC
jgi:hypothetical protein